MNPDDETIFCYIYGYYSKLMQKTFHFLKFRYNGVSQTYETANIFLKIDPWHTADALARDHARIITRPSKTKYMRNNVHRKKLTSGNCENNRFKIIGYSLNFEGKRATD